MANATVWSLDDPSNATATGSDGRFDIRVTQRGRRFLVARAPGCALDTFPLPAGAAVYRCEMHVNGRIVRAKVEAREDAKRIYREQKAAGRRAAMVEVERENLFTLSLGNVQPDDVIVIRFAWFQTLERIATDLSLRIPVCPGIRYIPGKPLLRSLSGRGASDDTDEVPDASRISPPRIDALHPDAAYFAVAGKIATSDVAVDSLSSPSHLVALQNGEATVNLALAENGAVPDRDFVLRWTEPKEAALTPRAWSRCARCSCADRFAPRKIISSCADYWRFTIRFSTGRCAGGKQSSVWP